MKRIALFLLLLCLLLPSPASAQTSPISWTVEVGFNGSYKAGAWIPVTIDIANGGNDLRGRLRWRWSTTTAIWSQEIDLPRGSQKRVILPVTADTPVGATATLELLDGSRVVASERIRSTQIDVNRAVIGVVSAASNALADVAGMYADIASGAVLIRLDPATFPDRAELLQTFDVLFVHDADTAAWSDAQRMALQTWVAEGGRVVVGGDRPQTAAGLGDIAAATVGGDARDVPVSAFGDTAYRPADGNATLRVVGLAPVADSRVLIALDGAPIVVRRSYGSGQVIQTAFNLASFSAAGETVAFWEQLLPWSEHSRQWYRLRSAGEQVLRQGLRLPNLALPSIWLIIGFLGLYIALVGPANYLLLKRLDRREWAYLTIPITVALFTTGAYLLGAAGRGGNATASGISVVRAVPGSERGHALNFMGIFSPTRFVYEAALPADALVSNPFSVWSEGSATLPVVRTESAVTVPDFLIDVGSLRPLLSESTAIVPRVEASFRRDGETLVIDLENRSTAPLADLVLLAGETINAVDALAPGERRSIEVDLQNMFADVLLENTEFVRRNDALYSLRWAFDGALSVTLPDDYTVTPLLGEDGSARPPVMLIAWDDGTPQPSITLNGQAVEVRGETMYVWPVREVQP